MVSRIEQEVGDAALVERAKGGDSDAWGVLVRRYMRRALSVAWGIVRNAHDAEDITQEALVKAFRKIGSFRSGEAFGPWLLRIVTNLALDHYRASRRRAEESLDEAMPARERTGAVAIETIARRIDEAIEALPEMQRIVARLYLVEEMSHAEIATITELSEGTVRSHLSHARKKLQEMLRDVREESGDGTR